MPGAPRPLIAVVTEAFSGGVARQLLLAARALPPLGWRLHFIVSPGRSRETLSGSMGQLAGPGSVVERLDLERGLRPWADWRGGRDLRGARGREYLGN